MRWLVAGVVALVVLGGAAAAQTLTLTRDEAIALARRAFLTGEPALTYAITSKIAEGDPADVEALLLLSASTLALGQEGALAFGKRAWTAAQRAGRPDALRYEIAQAVARAAWAADKKRVTAFWLDRSLGLAPDPATRADVAANLGRVRSEIKLTFAGNLQVSPTDNVNRGANTGLLVVQDTVFGSISGWSVAHAGVVTTGALDASYTLGVTASGKARNSLGFGVAATLHSLTRSEAANNPALDASDLDMYTGHLSWTQERYLDGALFEGVGPVRLTLAASQNWYDGQPYSPGLRAEVDLPLRRADRVDALSLNATLERQWQDEPSGVVDGASLHLRGEAPVSLPWATGKIGYAFGGSVLRGGWANATYDSLDATVTLDPGVAIGPVQSRFGLGMTWRDYDAYSLGFANVTKGRTDRGLWVRADFGLQDLAVAGLTPTLSVMRQMSWSNISKYETVATSVYLGLAADF